MGQSRIFLEGIEVFAYGGITEAERQTGQRYQVEVSVDFDYSMASGSDDIEQTISYVLLYEIVNEVLRSAAFRLIEAPTKQIADRILSATPASSVTVALRKLNPPIDGVVRAAGVELTVTR